MKLLLVVLVVFIVETCYCKSLDPPRIVGGDYAKVDQFPHQVALLYRGSLRCGGSIIEPGVVLTASHCLVGSDYGNLEVLAGTIDLKSGGVRRRVKKEVKHEKYGSFMNDVALLVLDEPFEFSSSIQRIELQNDELELISNVTIIGWGKTSNWGFPSQMLKYNTVKVDSIVGCSGLGYEGIICLGHPFDNGACNGDSGGSAIQNGKLVGVANFVVSGCGSQNPDGYAKVSFFVDWIRENIARLDD